MKEKVTFKELVEYAKENPKEAAIAFGEGCLIGAGIVIIVGGTYYQLGKYQAYKQMIMKGKGPIIAISDEGIKKLAKMIKEVEA